MSFGFGIKRNATDAYFSDLIRERDKWICQRCLRDYSHNHQGLHSSHYIGRGNKSTRWDQENACALCFYCHKYFTENPHEHYEFFFKRLGKEKYDKLMARYRMMLKSMLMDEKMIRLGLRLELKRIKKDMKIIGGK